MAKMFIAGESTGSSSGQTYDVINPATGEVVDSAPKGTESDVRAAIDAAHAAFQSWSETAAEARAQLIVKGIDTVKKELPDLAALLTKEQGKPLGDSQREIEHFLHGMNFYAGLASKIRGSYVPLPDNKMYGMVLKQPVGVTGAIVPWNFPITLMGTKVGPALAAGCTVVVKPASTTPLTTTRIVELLNQAGLPKGVLNVVTGEGPTAGRAIVESMQVDKVAFTGGTETGREVLKGVATSNLKKVSLELGGKSPNIFFSDADLDAAADGALFGIFINQGEVCSAGSRILVQQDLFKTFVGRMKEMLPRIVLGNPLNRNTKMGPLVSEEHLEKVEDYIAIGRKEAKLVAGGRRPSSKELKNGYFVEPTIFESDNKARIAREEIFGPVVACIPFKDEDDALQIANDTPYGLAAAVWSRDIFKCLRIVKNLRAGIVWVNTMQPCYVESPWGGYKQSGHGRELSLHGIEEFLETKQVHINLSERPIGWY